MTSIKISGKVTSSIINIGNNNTLTTGNTNRVLGDDDLLKYINELRDFLMSFEQSSNRKLENAMNEAQEEASKPQPDKNELAESLERAVKYVKNAESFVGNTKQLANHLSPIVSWLGSSGMKLIEAASIPME